MQANVLVDQPGNIAAIADTVLDLSVGKLHVPELDHALCIYAQVEQISGELIDCWFYMSAEARSKVV